MDERPPPAAMPARYLLPAAGGRLTWGPLREGRLVRRYRRFLADVILADGSAITAHTPNTGAMLGCSEPGRRVWLSEHDGAARKYRHTLEMIEMPTALVGVNTGVPNKLVKHAVSSGRVPEIPVPDGARSEVRRGESRLDLLFAYRDRPDALVEVKNCTLAEGGTAFFPDAETRRGAKHLEELARVVESGGRGVIFIVVQRADADRFAPADHIDPRWGETLRRVLDRGVELLAYRAELDLEGIAVGTRLPLVV